MKIMFFGDSITEGQYVGAPFRWFDIVSHRLSKELDAEFYMGADSGDTVLMAHNRFARQVQQIEPNWLFIQFGLNDSNKWKTDRGHPRVSKRLFKAAIEDFISRAEKFNVRKVSLIDSHSVTKASSDYGPIENLVKPYNQVISELAQTYKLSYLSLSKISREWRNEDYLLSDGIHLSRKGHELVGNAMIEFLKKNF